MEFRLWPAWARLGRRESTEIILLCRIFWICPASPLFGFVCLDCCHCCRCFVCWPGSRCITQTGLDSAFKPSSSISIPLALAMSGCCWRLGFLLCCLGLTVEGSEVWRRLSYLSPSSLSSHSLPLWGWSWGSEVNFSSCRNRLGSPRHNFRIKGVIPIILNYAQLRRSGSSRTVTFEDMKTQV